MDVGMGIEPEGEVNTAGEQEDRVTDGEVRGRDAGRPVEMNPFWSEKARAEAERVPEGSEGTGHPHGDQEGWQHPETLSSGR